MPQLDDMHCHLDFMANAREVASDANEADTLLFANTVTPKDWIEARGEFSDLSNVALGFGIHPWWVASDNPDGKADSTDGDLGKTAAGKIRDLLECYEPLILGEVGLDYGKRHQATIPVQEAVFKTLLEWAGRKGGRLLSLHSVQSAEQVLQMLRGSGVLDTCTCIFHWYSGPSDLLKQAVDAGCYFSCGPQMLATGKGREYLKAIPQDQLLLETDAPPGRGVLYSYGELRSALETIAEGVATAKGPESLEVIARSARRLIGADSPFRYTST